MSTSNVNNSKGIILMILAMLGFTLEDLFIKKLTATISISQILLVLGSLSCLVFLLLALIQKHKIFQPAAWTKITVTRMIAEAIAAITFVISLALVPLSTVAAILQATPLTITMGAALFMGEQVGWRRWLAIIFGFLGVLLIVRPGLTGFDPAVLFVLVSVVGITVRDLITRLISETVNTTVISFQAFAALVITGLLSLLFSSDTLTQVNTLESSYIVGGVIFGVLGYYGIVAAMRIGDASVVSPYRYCRLIFSLIVGILIFKEQPDELTLIGAAIIVFSGLYAYLRERQLSKQ